MKRAILGGGLIAFVVLWLESRDTLGQNRPAGATTTFSTATSARYTISIGGLVLQVRRKDYKVRYIRTESTIFPAHRINPGKLNYGVATDFRSLVTRTWKFNSNIATQMIRRWSLFPSS